MNTRKNSSDFPVRRWYGDAFGISGAVFLLTLLLVIFNVKVFINFEDNITATFQSMFGLPKMDYSGGLLNDIMTFVASYFDTKPIIAITIVVGIVLILRRQIKIGIWLMYVVASGGIIGLVLKALIKRPRPLHHLPIDNGYSFPSGHSLASTLLIWAIIFVVLPLIKKENVRRIVGWLLVLLWVLILFSRLYFAAHHFGDVLGGVSFSLAWLWLNMALYPKIFTRN